MKQALFWQKYAFVKRYLLGNPTSLGPIYTKRQRQHCDNSADNACDSVLIENNGVASEWGCNLFSSNSTNFNENRIVSVIAELS